MREEMNLEEMRQCLSDTHMTYQGLLLEKDIKIKNKDKIIEKMAEYIAFQTNIDNLLYECGKEGITDDNELVSFIIKFFETEGE